MENKDLKKPLTAEEVSKRVGCTPQHIYKQAKKNKIPHYRIGYHIRFPADIVEKFILKGIAE